MRKVIAISFEKRDTAFAVRKELIRLRNESGVLIEHLEVVTRDVQGMITLHQPLDLKALGTLHGTLLGALGGMVLWRPVAGGTLGAGLGAISGTLLESGLNADYKRQFEKMLEPDSSAIVITLDLENIEPLLESLQHYNGTVLRTSLVPADEKRLVEALQGKPAQLEPDAHPEATAA